MKETHIHCLVEIGHFSSPHSTTKKDLTVEHIIITIFMNSLKIDK